MKIAINGFGRIGRLAFRQVFDDNGIEIAAINDLTSPEMLAYLLKYDSVQGQFKNHEVTSDDTAIIVDGVRVPVYSEADASKLPWGELGIDIVLECTGFFTSKAKSQAHIDAGAKKVLISAPAGDDLPTIVYGVNHDKLTKEDNIVSGASCTTNCLAPMAKALNDYREVRTGFMTTIHAYTGDQKILDSPHKKGNKRRARAGAVNIVPNSTGAAKAIGIVIPELDGKLIGSLVNHAQPAPRGGGRKIRRAEQKGILLENVVNFPSAEGVIAAGYDVGAACKNAVGRKGGNAVSFGGIFPVHNCHVDGISAFELGQLFS